MRRLAFALPLLALAACGERADVATWVCAGQPDLQVAQTEESVQIASSDGAVITLTRDTSQSGRVYTGGGAQWLPTGTQALFVRGESTVNCRKLRTRQ